MPTPGQTLDGPGGFRLTFVSIDPELLEMEAHYAGGGTLPPEHLHPAQAERFELLEGTMLTVIDGVERTYEAPASFDVPAGTPHQMVSDGPARVRWQVRPALRSAEMAERMYATSPDERTPEKVAAFLREFASEIRMTKLPSPR
jgi:hypothetical protein